MLRNNTATQRRPGLIIEMVGLAGAGKTTLTNYLCRQNENIQIAPDIQLRKLKHFLIFFAHLPEIINILFRFRKSNPKLSWDEIKSIVYLNTWSKLLKQEAKQTGNTILLDHGPIFKMATLYAFGPEWLKRDDFQSWWQSIYERWDTTLNIVIWLYAPEPLLGERINSRDQRHAVKGKSELEVFQFLEMYDISYKHVMSKMKISRNPSFMKFDTNKKTIKQISTEILSVIYADLELTEG